MRILNPSSASNTVSKPITPLDSTEIGQDSLVLDINETPLPDNLDISPRVRLAY